MENVYVAVVFLLCEFQVINGAQPCQGNNCKCNLLTIKNGSVLNVRRNGRQIAMFKCRNGFELNSTVSLVCLTNGNWYGTLPACNKAADDTPTESEKETSTSQLSLKPNASDGSQVAAIVIPLVVIAIVAAGIVAFFLWWRKKRGKRFGCLVKRPEDPVSGINNMNYNEHIVDKQSSRSNTQISDPVDSGYAEITLENLSLDERTGDIYQTIDNMSVHEDIPESSTGYGHLKIQSTTFVDKNYSHFNGNLIAGESETDTTYSLTESATNQQELNDMTSDECKLGNTYNRLGAVPNSYNGTNRTEAEEKNLDDLDSEYNHASAGAPTSPSDDKTDTYSHLKRSCQNPQPYMQNCKSLNSPDNPSEKCEVQPNELANVPKIQSHEMQKERKLQQDGYVMAVGTKHNYFILEPEIKTSGHEVLFHVVEDNTETKSDDSDVDTKGDDSDAEAKGDASDAEAKGDASGCAKTPDHQYFTLEKTETELNV